MFDDPTNWQFAPTLLIGGMTVRVSMLVFGLAAFAGGILLMFNHKRAYEEAFRNEKSGSIRLFEHRKFRRRTTASCLISAIGVMLASLYWATEPVPFTALVTMILILLVALLVLASLDLMSVGLQNIAHPDDSHRQQLIDEVIQKREQLAREKEAAESE